MSNELTFDLIVVDFEGVFLNVIIPNAVDGVSVAEAHSYAEQGEQAPIQ